MKISYGLQPDTLPASVVTLGMFDGVHRGHQALLSSCRRHADRLGLPAVALTYEPHPTRVLRPGAPLRLLTLLPEKLERLARGGMDQVVVAEFTIAFSQLAAEEYLGVLVAALHPRLVVAGYRTTFGRGRGGSPEVLREIGAAHGFEVEIVEPVIIAGDPVSSSHIRECLDHGDVERAAVLLGYHYGLTGMVTVGDRRGRQLGIPTANLDVPAEKLVPADGIYVVNACVAGGVTHRAVMSIGPRPVFNRPRALEVHLLDFNADLYHQPLTITFLRRLRDIRAFPDPQTLVAQIHEDIAQARATP